MTARLLSTLLALVLLLSARLAGAATVSTEISGVAGELLANVRASISLVQAEKLDELSLWRLRQMSEDARSEIEQALRPFGFYRPDIRVRLIEPEDDSQHWQARLDIKPGPPVQIDRVMIELLGDGRDDPALKEWREEWPLKTGDRLHHPAWEKAWRRLAQIAEERGYFQARFDEREVTVGAEREKADIRIVFDTGPRYRFGRYRAPDQPFSESLMNRLHILEPDEAYSVERLDRQREVLVRSGLFDRVVVDTERDDERQRVDLDYRLETRPPN
ncbi:MAG TPA: POTRA domain-containing protein, partial [Wenzhouxiangella sp.]|nr:POTRA domain-containing protein [Wenzhouxiangella sp.]